MTAALFLVSNQRSEASAIVKSSNFTTRSRYYRAATEGVRFYVPVETSHLLWSSPFILLLDCRQCDPRIFMNHQISNNSTHSPSKSACAFKCIYLVGKLDLKQSVIIYQSFLVYFLVKVHFSGGLSCFFMFWCFSLPLNWRTFSEAISCIALLNPKGKMCLYCPIMGTFAVYTTSRTSSE